MIEGITIQYLTKTQTGTDGFNRPVYSTAAEDIANVLVAPVTDTEVLQVLNLTGRKAVYELAIPKGDTHNWIDQQVVFFGATWRTIGMPLQGIDALLPLGWNKKVRVECINGS